MLSWVMIMVLALGSVNAMADQNQNPTQTVCLGQQSYNVDPVPGATFTWAVTGGGTIIFGQGTDSIVVDWTQVGGPYTLSVFATVNGCSSVPQVVDITVVAAPVGPTLLAKSPDANEVCAGTLVSATFNPGSGGVNCADEFEYSFDGDGNWFAYVPNDPLNTTNHTLVEIRGRRGCDATLGCGATDWVVLASWTVTTALPVSVTITADPNPVCEGSTVTFTSVAVNEGTTPIYSWYVNGVLVDGADQSTYTYEPTNGDVVWCKVASSEPCATGNPATSNEITIVVNPIPVTSGIWHN